jgi:hypothetical protein
MNNPHSDPSKEREPYVWEWWKEKKPEPPPVPLNPAQLPVSEEDFKDFMALLGVGPFKRQVSTNTKKEFAEAVPVLAFFAVGFGILLILWLVVLLNGAIALHPH